MHALSLSDCFDRHTLILTEGAVGQRLERTYALRPDREIMYAALLYDTAGREALSAIYRSYLQVARDCRLPMLLMTNTRRANQERMLRSQYSGRNVMQDYASFLHGLAEGFACDAYIGGMMGCKGDAYSGDGGLSTEEAVAFHTWQMRRFDTACLDFLFAGIMPTLPEAIGMAKVMAMAQKPYIISLMLRRNGRLPDGTSLSDAIRAIDRQADLPPLCYMTNCIHPLILLEALQQPFNRTEPVMRRFCGIQANAANLDPEQLDGSGALQTSGPQALGEAFAALHASFPLKIAGGCCGTDDSHLRAIADRLR